MHCLSGKLNQTSHVIMMKAQSAGTVKDDPYGVVPRGKAQVSRAPLSSVLTLDSKYFPDELFSSTEKR
jgi:hypothetical protein